MHMLYADISLLTDDEDQAIASLYSGLDALELGRDLPSPAERTAAVSVFDQIRSVHMSADNLTDALSATEEATRLINVWLTTEWAASTQFQLAEHFVHQGELKVRMGRTAEAVADLQNAIQLLNAVLEPEYVFEIDGTRLMNVHRRLRMLQSEIESIVED